MHSLIHESGTHEQTLAETEDIAEGNDSQTVGCVGCW